MKEKEKISSCSNDGRNWMYRKYGMANSELKPSTKS